MGNDGQPCSGWSSGVGFFDPQLGAEPTLRLLDDGGLARGIGTDDRDKSSAAGKGCELASVHRAVGEPRRQAIRSRRGRSESPVNGETG